MSVRTIVEHGCPLTVQTLERVDALGATYWQARAMFRTASGGGLASMCSSGQGSGAASSSVTRRFEMRAWSAWA